MSGIVTIGITNFNITQSCNDDVLIDKLKNDGKLNPTVKYSLNCPSGISYISGNQIGGGGFNRVYNISGDSGKVLRVTMEEVDKEDLSGEISGLFLQSYMSKPTTEGGLGCENICKVFEFGYLNKGTEYERVYAILELLPTNNLLNYIETKKYELENPEDELENPEDNLELKSVFKGVLEGLKCMNINKYIHLDMKCENVGLDEKGKAKIFDFGFARYLPDLSLNNQPWNGTFFYTDPYYRDTGTISINSDIYSVGVMIIETYFQYEVEYKDRDSAKLILKNLFNKNTRKWDEFTRNYFDSVFDRNNPLLLENLVKKMICAISKRYKSDEALKDPWFTEIIPSEIPSPEPAPAPAPAPAPEKTTTQKSFLSRIFGSRIFGSRMFSLKRGGRLSRRKKNGKKRQSKSFTRRRSQRPTH